MKPAPSLEVVNGNFVLPASVQLTGTGALESAFDVTGLAAAAMAEAGLAVARLSARLGSGPASPGPASSGPAVSADRGLASLWFSHSFTPQGWEPEPPWNPVSGDYPCADGWIRLHANADHHRRAALAVLGLEDGMDDGVARDLVAAAVSRWSGEGLEAAIVRANGCAAVMRSAAEWAAHPQGAAVAAEPIVHWGPARTVPGVTAPEWPVPEWPAPALPKAAPATPDRPLQGVRVLDLTRVIAGPVATRFLAMYGAEVLRIDPPWWEEAGLEPELTVGKRCARLDLKDPRGLDTLCGLLAGADIVVHGYRADALDRLGLSDDALAALNPGLVNVALDAYGWSGPWALRRGFDSLVQMSCGIAAAGMAHFGTEAPRPLPVQALDHATGYLVAAAVLDAWRGRLDGTVRNARLSLARTAVELQRTVPTHDAGPLPGAESYSCVPEETAWGPGLRLPAAVTVEGVPAFTHVPARGFGAAEPQWSGSR